MSDSNYSRYQDDGYDKEMYRRYTQMVRDEKKALGNDLDNQTDAHGTYGALLFDPRWKAKREYILARDTHRCVICKDNQSMQVHHRQYYFDIKENQFRMPWDYPDHLLISLCESCHRRGHSKYNVPIIKI